MRPDGTLYASRHLAIVRSRDDGASWERVTALPRDPLRRAAEWSRLASRLLRHEVRALAELDDGRLVAANRVGVFAGRPGDARLARSQIDDGGLPALPPLCIGAGPGAVVFGEYGSPRGRPMRLFASRDGGARFAPVHAFAPGEVLHVHNVVWDAGERHYWVLTGDFDAQPGIGRLSSDLARFEWFVRGEQRFRAVDVFDCGDRLVYATDTQLEANSLVSLDKRTGRSERGRPFEGSCIYACRFGAWFAITTTVEPSPVNPSRDATLWVSRDLDAWHCVLRAPKDRWHADYFQFGSLVLPRGRSERATLHVSGQAVRGLDGRLVTGAIAGAAG
ncbi:MAG: hypothetical protein DCC71_19000 [Proteobacteria bacterium]|nr:MAG: hypothetical protein DCC71_19000 [Pseudomonadota bacterium]